MPDGLKTPFGVIAPPWIKLTDARDWIIHWFGTTPTPEWMLHLLTTVVSDDGRVHHRVDGLNSKEFMTFVPGTPDDPYWLKLSPHYLDHVIVAQWDEPFFDPQSFTISGPPQHNGVIRRHPIEVRSAHVQRLWHDSQQPNGHADRNSTTQPQATPSKGGAPPKYDWEAFWREVARYADHDGLDAATRTLLHRHMVAWAAQEWTHPPDDATIRARLKTLFDETAASDWVPRG